jgi:hypothetical protein
LLLAEQFAKRVHFGANLSFEQQVGGGRETDYELNAAISYAVMDKKLALGMEMLLEYEIEREIDEEDGTPPETHSSTLMLGPTVLFKPTRNTHVGLVPLFGVTHDAPAMEAFLIFGIDFEPFARKGTANDSEKNELEFQPLRKPR